MKITAFVLLFLMLLSSKEIQKEEINETGYITIVFKNPNIKDTIFYGKENYTIHENQICYRVENSFIDNTISVSNQEKTVRIKSEKPIFVYHHYYVGDNYFNYYCFYPNDTLTFEYKGGVPYVQSKKQKKYNYNHGAFFNLKYPTDTDEDLFLSRFKRYKNASELMTDKIARDNRELKQIVFWDSLRNEKKVDEMDYNLNLSYLKNKEKLNSSNPLQILNQSYNLADVGNTFLVRSAFGKMFKTKLIAVSSGKMPNYREQFENAVSLRGIHPINRNYLMFSYLESIALTDSKENFLKYYAVLEKETTDVTVKEYFKNKYALFFMKNKDIKGNEISLLDEKKNSKTFKEILNANNGKVVYVDFWASWCMPCRQLMPASLKLHHTYKEKNVTFIYISIDNNFDKWIVASKKEGLLVSTENFLAINYPNASLYQELQLKAIPRYLIYDKTGKLVNGNAPSPDSNEIITELDKLLSK